MEVEAKVVLLGGQGVGKTSVVLQYVQGVFTNTVPTTIGASFFTQRLIISGTRVKLQLWDTAGQERFRSMAPMYYRNARAAVLVYDVTSKQSLADLSTWVAELRGSCGPGLVIAVIGNKADLADARTVSSDEGERFARSVGALFFEVSAKDNAAVRGVFLSLVEALLRSGTAAQSGRSGVDVGKESAAKPCCS